MEVRNAGLDDGATLDAALLAAANWEPVREPLPLEHPTLAPYRADWGRPGDLGVVAEEDGRTVGAAFCRLVPGGYGFVDEHTPELTIGVDEAYRGRGVGATLLAALHRLARFEGFDRLSLSVEPTNPARRLYERAGYREAGRDEGGSVTMVKQLPAIRAATAEDAELIQWTLYAALDWDPARELPPFELVMAHPEAERYHRGWGRPGDIGVVAELGGEPAGVAYARLFTDDDHGHGYADAETPEVAVAVRDGHRGEGIGADLLRALAALARERGVARLSLSVDNANPARRLYERLGYRPWSEDEDGVRMLSELR